MLFKDYNLNQFISEVSSDAPSPGGGSVAAFVLALSSSLNSMVYSLTVDKKSYNTLTQSLKDKMLKFQKEALEFNEKALEFMENDRKDFVKLMASYKLPKDTESQKIERQKQIKENTYNAMNTPLQLAEEAFKFYKNIFFAVEYGNRNLISDAGVAAILLHSAIESAIINVKVNLNFLRDEEYCANIESLCKMLNKKSHEEKDKILKKVNDIIYPV